jgi:hypothetical protein
MAPEIGLPFITWQWHSRALVQPQPPSVREIGAWKIPSFKGAVVFRRNLIFQEHMYPDFYPGFSRSNLPSIEGCGGVR